MEAAPIGIAESPETPPQRTAFPDSSVTQSHSCDGKKNMATAIATERSVLLLLLLDPRENSALTVLLVGFVRGSPCAAPGQLHAGLSLGGRRVAPPLLKFSARHQTPTLASSFRAVASISPQPATPPHPYTFAPPPPPLPNIHLQIRQPSRTVEPRYYPEPVW